MLLLGVVEGCVGEGCSVIVVDIFVMGSVEVARVNDWVVFTDEKVTEISLMELFVMTIEGT